MTETNQFQEIRYLSRGYAGRHATLVGLLLGLAGIVAAANDVLVAALVMWVLGAVMVAAVKIVRAETTIHNGEITLRLFPLPARRYEIPAIVEAVIVVADYNVNLYGGWKGSRGGMWGALVEDLEGPRQLGNRAVELTFADGATVEVGTFRPSRLLAAIESGRAEA